MIGKPEWFKYRIFGWGVAPKTWQGWIYVAAWIAVIAGSTLLPIAANIKPWVFGILIFALLLDVFHIMFQLPAHSDERENMHQLIIERNCSFAAIVALIGVAAFQTYQNNGFAPGYSGPMPFDISILIVLGVMLATKILSTAYVKWKM